MKAFTRPPGNMINRLLIVIALIGLLTIINLIVYKNPINWDLTEDRTNSLSPETIYTLAALPSPVYVRAFFSTQAYNLEIAKTLLGKYQYYGKDNFVVEWIDPQTDAIAAEKAGITRDEIIVVTLNGRSEQIAYPDEQEITSALIKLINPNSHIIYFLSGHGELDIQSTGDSSLTQVRNALEAKNYTVKALNFAVAPSIPSDASAIVVAGAEKPLSQAEVILIKNYLDQNGSAIFLLEPAVLVPDDPQWQFLSHYLQSEWGIAFTSDIIINQNSIFDPVIAIGTPQSYADHPVTQKLHGLTTLFPSSHAVLIDDVPSGVMLEPIITTDSAAWGEMNIQSIQDDLQVFNSDQDIPGPLNLAVIAAKGTTNSRIAVVGDSDFAMDVNFFQYGNGDLMINLVDWASKQENLVTLTPKQVTNRVIITPTGSGIGVIFLIVFTLPLLVLFAGIYTRLRRKRKG